jgi:uroporphyrinogen-III synthase
VNRQRVLFTRKIDDELVEYASEHGIQIIEREMIEIRTLKTDATASLVNSLYGNIVVFTSANAVKAVAEQVRDENRLNSCRLYVVGESTGAAVLNYLKVVPEPVSTSDARSLALEIIRREPPGPVTFFCGDMRRDELPRTLNDAGYQVNEVIVYKTELSPERVHEQVDAIAFLSPSAVQSFFVLNKVEQSTVCYSIGNTTTAELRKYTGSTIITAKEPTIKCLLHQLISSTNTSQ